MFRKIGFASFSVSILAFVFSFNFASHVEAAVNAGQPKRALITQEIDESRPVTLKGNTRPEANAVNDRGAVAEDFQMEHILLQLRRSPEQEQALEQFIDQLHTPGSPNFHRWLTAQEFGEKFGLAQDDLNTITNWLQSHGFQVNVVYPSGMVIDFSGSAGQVREAFRTEIHNLEVRGVKHMANMSDPHIPAALVPAVLGVVSLNDFRPHSMHKLRPNYTFTSGGSTYQAVVPPDLATIYNLKPLFSAGYSGQGQTIVVIEDTNVYSTADWGTFRTTFGLSGYTAGSFGQVHPAPPSGSNNCSNPGVNGDDGEAILDAEWASAAAPSAAIELASCADTYTTFGGLLALQNLLNESSTPPAIVSISYGECEAYNGASANAAYSSTYQQAVAEGVSVFVSSGDEGAASCDAGGSNATHGIGVSGLASTPYNVAVGGTDFGDTYAGTNNTYWNSATNNTSTYGSAKSYIPEIPWNDSCASTLIAGHEGYGTTYGSSGSCNSGSFLTVVSGSGGPSGCATGTASTSGVVSGTCQGFAKPSWQSIVGNPSDNVRDIPDLSLFAANGVWGHYYVFCWSDTANGGAACSGAPSGWAGAGGTSFSSPIIAGIQALVNQKWGRQGNPNPVYYQLAASEYGSSGSSSCNSTSGNSVGSSCIFYDVTQGDMDVNCTGTHNCYRPSGTYGVLSTSNSSYSNAYGTTTGWDFATGIGTVNAYNLVNNWNSGVVPPTPSIAISSVNPGSITLVQGGSAQGLTVNLTRSNYTDSITLSITSALPTGVSANITQPGSGNSGAISLQAASGATTGSNQITITASGTGGVSSVTANFSLTVVPPPSIAISGVSPNPITLVRGGSAQILGVGLTRSNYTGSLTLLASGLPSGVTATYTQPGSGNSGSISLKAASGAATGSTQITLTASGSGVSATATFTLTVNPTPSIAISSVSPSSVTLARGGSAQSLTVNLKRTSYTGSITLSTSSLPSGVTATYTQPGTGTSGTIKLQAASNASVVSNRSITITASGTGVSSATATFTLTVTTPTIAISSVSPNPITLVRGGSAQPLTVGLTRSNFTGSVTLSTSNLSSGVTATYTQPGTGTSGSIKLQAASNASVVSNRSITITAKGSGVSSATATFTLTVSSSAGRGH
jgi:subtilase family serine protease